MTTRAFDTICATDLGTATGGSNASQFSMSAMTDGGTCQSYAAHIAKGYDVTQKDHDFLNSDGSSAGEAHWYPRGKGVGLCTIVVK